MDLRSYRQSGAKKTESSKKPISPLFQSAWDSRVGGGGGGGGGVQETDSDAHRSATRAASAGALSQSSVSYDPSASSADVGGYSTRGAGGGGQRTDRSSLRRAHSATSKRSALWQFWHLIPPLTRDDRGVRRCCVTALRYPLQFCRHWQSMTFILVYLCISVMLYDLYVNRRSMRSLKANLLLNETAEMAELAARAQATLPDASSLSTSVAGAASAPQPAVGVLVMTASPVPPVAATAAAATGGEATQAVAALATTLQATTPAPVLAAPPVIKGDQVLVYTLPLDASFNKECVAKLNSLKATVHLDFTNYGLGPPLDVSDDPHIHYTSRLALEVTFHHRLKASRFHTDDLSKAHAVYVPYFAGLLARFPQCRESQSVDQVEEKLAAAVAASSAWQSWAGKRHFMVFGEQEETFLTGGKCPGATASSSTASSLLCNKLLAPIIALVPQLAPADYVGRRAGNPKVVIPMASAVHFDKSIMDPVGFAPLVKDVSKRTMMAAYVLDKSVPGGKLADMLAAEVAQALGVSGGAVVVALDMNAGSTQPPADWDLRIVELFRRSTFCMLLPGQPALPSLLMNALALGCIPVLFRKMVLPLAASISYADIIIEVSEADIISNELKVIGHLAQIYTNAAMMEKRRQALRAVVSKLQYAQPEPGSSLTSLVDVDDAFSAVMKEVVATLSKQ